MYGKLKNQKSMNVQSPEFIPNNTSFSSSNGDNNSEWASFNINQNQSFNPDTSETFYPDNVKKQ